MLLPHINIDALDGKGETPLMAAAEHGEPLAVELLLTRGANAEIRNAEGLSASDMARNKGEPDIADQIDAFVLASKESDELERSVVNPAQPTITRENVSKNITKIVRKRSTSI